MKHASQMAGLQWRQLAAGNDASAAVSYYGADQRHDMHEHDAAHVSLILAGGVEERTARDIAEAGAGALRVRPDGFRHAVTFHPRGALILTLPAPSQAGDAGELGRAWRTLERPRACCAVLRNLFAGVACDPETASIELIAIASPTVDKGMPLWLRAARERMIEAPANARIDALASEAGVHRVHFARVFDAKFGVPPSVMRRRAMLEHALAAILSKGRSLAEAAAGAGFADQAHMSRAFSEFLGVAPSRLRTLLRSGYIGSRQV